MKSQLIGLKIYTKTILLVIDSFFIEQINFVRASVFPIMLLLVTTLKAFYFSNSRYWTIKHCPSTRILLVSSSFLISRDTIRGRMRAIVRFVMEGKFKHHHACLNHRQALSSSNQGMFSNNHDKIPVKLVSTRNLILRSSNLMYFHTSWYYANSTTTTNLHSAKFVHKLMHRFATFLKKWKSCGFSLQQIWLSIWPHGFLRGCMWHPLSFWYLVLPKRLQKMLQWQRQ